MNSDARHAPEKITTWEPIRCPRCDKLLFKVPVGHDSIVQIVCRGCKAVINWSRNGIVIEERKQ